MTIKELFDYRSAVMDGDPKAANQEVMVGMRSLKGCRQRCLLQLDQIDMYGNDTHIFLVEDRI